MESGVHRGVKKSAAFDALREIEHRLGSPWPILMSIYLISRFINHLVWSEHNHSTFERCVKEDRFTRG